MIADESILPKASENRSACKCIDFPQLIAAELSLCAREERWTPLEWEEVVATIPALQETSRRYEGDSTEFVNFQCRQCQRTWLLEVSLAGPAMYVW